MQWPAMGAGHLSSPSCCQACDALIDISIFGKRTALRHLLFETGGDTISLIARQDTSGAPRSVDETPCGELAQPITPFRNSVGQGSILPGLGKVRHGSLSPSSLWRLETQK